MTKLPFNERQKQNAHRGIYDEMSMYYHANLEQQVLELEVALKNPAKSNMIQSRIVTMILCQELNKISPIVGRAFLLLYEAQRIRHVCLYH